MSTVNDWAAEAAESIARATCGTDSGPVVGAIAEIIRAKCPFTPGVAYVPAGDRKGDFEAVGDFHGKFGLPTPADGPPRELTAEEFRFRTRFMLEELKEYFDAHGLRLEYQIGVQEFDPSEGVAFTETDRPRGCDMPQAFDALVDLAYVVLGTAHMHRFPWNDGFARVQRANMAKERCGIDHRFKPGGAIVDDSNICTHADGDKMCGKPKVAHSARGSALDVIKPAGWTAPNMIESLMAAGWKGPRLFDKNDGDKGDDR